MEPFDLAPAQVEIHNVDRNLKHARDSLLNLSHERDRLEATVRRCALYSRAQGLILLAERRLRSTEWGK